MSRRHKQPSRIGPSLLMRVLEMLLRRRTFKIAKSLAGSERALPSVLCGMQLRKLRRLVAHASINCPYYRRRGLPPAASIRSLENFRCVEPLSREDLHRHAVEMCWRGMPGQILIGHTHGTADQRFTYYWDRRRQAWDKANRLRGHWWHGFVPGDRELHVWPVDPPVGWLGKVVQSLRHCRDEVLGELQIDSLQAFCERLPLSWQAWCRFDPERVTAYPSVLAQLIQEARRVGCRIGNPSLRRIFLTGEVTFEWQRRLIEHELGVPTVQDYGLQEVGPLAYACEYGNWHVCAESVLIETLRDGRPALPGEYGEIVVTGLESLAMPVLRYCTGDIVKVERPAKDQRAFASTLPGGGDDSAPRCPCGITLPILPHVRGRASDFLMSRTGQWIEPANVVAVLGEILDEGSFQVLQDRQGGVEVRIITSAISQARGCDWGNIAISEHKTPRAPAVGPLEQAVRRRIERLVGYGGECVVKKVRSLNRSAFGKCRYVCSERTADGLARR
jgi:phenylacetate-CoA ligase